MIIKKNQTQPNPRIPFDLALRLGMQIFFNQRAAHIDCDDYKISVL